MTKRTSRGFRIYSDFRDSYGNRVRIQQSSAACMDAVWIFCDGESDGKMLPGDTKPFKSAPHLTVAQAKRVIRALERFVQETSGQSITEYTIVIALIALAVVLALSWVGPALNELVSELAGVVR